uniref:Uncharacterized protein n=1 Tax=uncultured bacterium contig00113 TaxID=1181576 RepID=A0A806KHS8_9BACT|nr:hypothetical protein [uncultured bacterium contig00113]
MANNDEIIFDANSGISVDEQREILSKINRIAEKNRRSLSEGMTAGETIINAKKTGALFPLLFNFAAVFILVGGAFFLFSFNAKMDVQIREGSGGYTTADRALIGEIRKETAEKIAAKENEIAAILSRLNNIGEELDSLYSSNQVLSQEQLAAEERLLSLQKNYRAELASSEEARARILEDSRSREAKMRSQLDTKTRELTELEQLTQDQEKAADIDALLSGSFAEINGMIGRNEFDQAAESIGNLQAFLATPSFESVRSYQSRRETYSQAINSMNTMVDGLRKSGGRPVAGSDDSQEKESEIERMKEEINEMQKRIDAADANSSGQARRLSELESTVSSLRSEKSALEANVAERNRRITSLETEKADLTQTVAARDNTIRGLESRKTEQDQQITSLSDQINSIRRTLGVE